MERRSSCDAKHIQPTTGVPRCPCTNLLRPVFNGAWYYVRTEARKRMLGMKLTNNRGLLALAIYLLLVGFMGAFGITLGALSILVPILAIVAGVLLLLGQ